MRKTTVITALLLSVFFLQGGSATAAEKIQNGYAIDEGAMVDNLTFGSSPTVSLNRIIVEIPQDYGKILSITPDASGTLIWFESGDGKARNVYVVGSPSLPLIIRRSGHLE